MKNSDLKKKKKFKNAYQNKRNISKDAKKLSFHFFHIYKKKKMVLKWDSNQHQFWQCSLTNWLSTNWANQVHAIRRQFLHHFNDQLGEAWFCKSTRIDGITSIQRALNILKRALSRCQLSSKCLV